MDGYVWWAIARMGLVILELLTGTFLLLILGLAAFGGAAAAWLGASLWIQVLVAVALASIGMIVVSKYHGKDSDSQDGVDNQSLDIGHTVVLESWVSEADGVARVRYRNAIWDARVVEPRTPGGTVFYIRELQANTLIVSSTKPT